jgi:hypothetical protein
MYFGTTVPGAFSRIAETEAALARQTSLLQHQFVALAGNLASTEERIARYYEQEAARHPAKAGKYWQAAQDARKNAQRAREMARRFSTNGRSMTAAPTT